MAKKNREAPPLYVVKMGDKLVGEMEFDRGMIAAMPSGVRIKVNLTSGRSNPRLRAYFAMLNDILNATDVCPDVETLHELVKLKTGYVTPVELKDRIILIPKSVSFAAMDEAEFNTFFRRAERFFAEEFGIDIAAIRTAA